MNPVKLCILGDTCSDRGYAKLFEEENIDKLLGESLDVIHNSDFSVLNLECPLTQHSNPICKTGPNLKGPPITAKKLADAGISAACIANNHILDYGETGLDDTIKHLSKVNIKHFGAGENIEYARRPVVFQKDDISIALYGLTESEFSNAGDTTPGANHLDNARWYEDIIEIKKGVNHLIVFLHAGKEHYPLPPPQLQKLCRSMVRLGASIVVCQHSHCIGAMEEYENSLIAYGQGNFLFEQDGKKTSAWNTGVAITAIFSKDRLVSYDCSYYEQKPMLPIINPLSSLELAEIHNYQSRINAIALHTILVKEYWKDLVRVEGYNRFLAISTFNGILLKFLRRSKLGRKLYGNHKLRTMQNMIRCQTHREMLLSYIDAEVSKSTGV